MKLPTTIALLAAALPAVVAEERELIASCPADIAARGVDGTCLLGGQNNDNPEEVVDGMFGVYGWRRIKKVQNPPTGVKSGTLECDYPECANLMIVFKGGQNGVSPGVFVAYKVDPSVTSYAYVTPFTNNNNGNDAQISHISYYCADGPTGEGDPHFSTWNGKWFDYMGQCDLKFLEAHKFDRRQDLEVQVRTSLEFDYSYIEAAAIRIGDDVLEVGGFGDYAVNGVDTPHMGGKGGRIGGYEIVRTEVNRKKTTYDVMLSHGRNITLASYKHLVSVKFHAPANTFDGSKGIIGSIHGDLKMRNGQIIKEASDAYGQEWQVTDQERMLFRTPRAPQYPQKCLLPNKPASSTQRRLGETIAQEAAEKACAHKTGAAFNNCVYDVMAIGDLQLAEAGAF